MNVIDFLLGRLTSASNAGGSELPSLTDPAVAADIRAGKEAINSAGRRLTGSMPEHNGEIVVLDCNSPSYTPPAGYHDGTGSVVIDFTDDLDVPADPVDIRLGKEAIGANGNKIVGTMPEYGYLDTTLNWDNSSFELPAGYYEGCLVNVDSAGQIRASAKADEPVVVRAEDRKFMYEVIIEPAADVYAAGVSAGEYHGRGLERKEFWDAFQSNGERRNYNYAFYGSGWTDAIFAPEHDIVVSNCTNMFQSCAVTDLVQRLADCGVRMVFADTVVSLYYFATASKITRFPVVGSTSVTNVQNTFNGCAAVEYIEKLVVSDTASCTFTNAFRSCSSLAEIRFSEGITPTDLNFQWSPLSRDSLVSLIGALADVSGTSGMSVVLGASNIAKLTAEELNMMRNKGWNYS